MHSHEPQRKAASSAPSDAHLTAEEWAMILEALRAYQHNEAYRSLYEKLAGQTS
jgi:hypothetical protein